MEVLQNPTCEGKYATFYIPSATSIFSELMTFLFCGLDHKIIQEAAQRGLPVCRHLFVHYPDDEYVLTLGHQQFLVGSEILVVPVLDKGKNNVQAYFPLGESSSWQHIWTGEVYAKPGCEIKVDTPVGYPAVFVKVGSIVGETFIKNLKIFNIL